MINFSHDESKHMQLQQINKVIVSEEQGLIIAGTEDNLIRFFDLHTYKQVKSIVAHADAVTSLLIPTVHATVKQLALGTTSGPGSGSHTFLSGGQDGAIRAWDLRTF